MTAHCANNEYGCDATIPDEREGERCDDCEQEQQATAAYYKALYDATPKPYTREEVMDAYSHPTEWAKRGEVAGGGG